MVSNKAEMTVAWLVYCTVAEMVALSVVEMVGLMDLKIHKIDVRTTK
jgi:hypothetical protein